MTTLKWRKVGKLAGVALLVGIGLMCSIQCGFAHARHYSEITSDADTSDKIVLVSERHRIRVLIDDLKPMSLLLVQMQLTSTCFASLNGWDPESLLVNAYQRNVFYVFAFSTVP